MSEPINNPTPTPTPAPAPEPTPEKTFTQAEVDAMIGKRLAKAMKGMPSEEELTAYRAWQAGQAGEKTRWDKLTGERDTLAGKLTAAEAERDRLKRDLYLAQKGLSYAEWARSGFFQMVGVTVVNLTLLLAAVQWSRREGGAWRAVRLLSALLTAESLLLLLSAAWRMTLYVDVYGLSFKRCMTYWGMGMMAAFLLAAAWKVRRPDFRFCRVVFPLALAGWLVINCVPVDYLVAKDQVDRYLSGESGVLDAEYLLYDLSYDTLSQLERLDGDMVCTAYGDWDAIGTARLSILLEQRRQEARTDCADWRTWSLSAWLASRGGA